MSSFWRFFVLQQHLTHIQLASKMLCAQQRSVPFSKGYQLAIRGEREEPTISCEALGGLINLRPPPLTDVRLDQQDAAT
jgi:hypothetical protein